MHTTTASNLAVGTTLLSALARGRIHALPCKSLLKNEIKLRLADGRLLGVVDTCIATAEAAISSMPLGWLIRLVGINALARSTHRRIAASRYCLGDRCAVTSAPERKHP